MTLRDLTTLDDLRGVVELEKRVWGYTDAEDVVPVPILAVTVKRGGILIGAFDPDGRMAGFVYSLPAFREGRLSQWSHMLGVVAEHRNTGLGRLLKLAQRDRALAMGIEVVEWTFDPLQALNAHFNFLKLGIEAEDYEENIYGESSSPLHRGTPTDRLVALWRLADERVTRRIGLVADAGIRQEAGEVLRWPATHEVVLEGSWLAPGDVATDLDEPALRLTIPMDIGALQLARPELARAWREATRRAFTAYLGRGYRVTDFLLDRPGGRGHYLLVR